MASFVTAVKVKKSIAGFLVVSVVIFSGGCGRGSSKQAFEKAKWNAARKSNPDLNACPSMLDDLIANHLSHGMTLAEVTNLLGPVEMRTPMGTGVRMHGEFLAQTVYVYHPGMHKGWRLQGTNSLVLYFGHRDEYLQEWSPTFVQVQPVTAVDSEAARDARTNGLHIGNLRYAGTPDQFDALLGFPDEQRTEYQLCYCLGKRSRFAWDEVFLDLHFDASNRLVRLTGWEH